VPIWSEPRLLISLPQVNSKLVWTRLANDIHAELFYADKFKDMVILERRALAAEKASVSLPTPGKQRPRGSPESEDQEDIAASVLEGFHSDLHDQEDAIVRLLSQFPYIQTLTNSPSEAYVPYWEKWNVPLVKPSDGDYELTIRRYHYTDQSCVSNSQRMITDVYGKATKPAKPLKFQPEQY